MTVLQRTDLTTSQKIQCAAAAVAGQHAHGSKTALSETYEISRPTVYAVGAAAESVLRSHFEAPLLQGAAVDVRVDDAQLRRAVPLAARARLVVALRVLAPNAIRPIEDLVPLLYPGVKVSYGTIQHMLVEAEARAARFNAQASLGGVEAGALDEMFSQGEPVLAGVDLDSGYLFGLSLSATRDGEAWAELLREGQCQGLELSVVVKDAAKGIAAGVSEVFPHAEQRDDCFHVFYEMNKVRRRLERRAYAAIEREGEALGRLGKIRAHDKVRRRKAKRELSSARRECAEAIERFDEFEAAMDTLRGALECVDIKTGELHRPEHVQALIEGVAQRIESLGVGECCIPRSFVTDFSVYSWSTVGRFLTLPRHRRRASAHACTDAAVIAVVVVKMGSPPRASAADGRAGRGRSRERQGTQNATSSSSSTKSSSCL